MIQKQHENENGYKISLNDKERDHILDECDHTDVKNTWIFAAFCGLRKGEIGSLKYKDIKQRGTGDYIIRVRKGKGDKYRETPLPDRFAFKINAEQEATESDQDDYIINVTMRHVSRLFRNLCDDLVDERYDDLTLHDGRRSWANSLLDQDISISQVMDWGGWADYKTFREHYVSEKSEKQQKENIEKVDWI